MIQGLGFRDARYVSGLLGSRATNPGFQSSPQSGEEAPCELHLAISMPFKVPSRPFALRTLKLFVQGLGADASGHAARVLKVANLSPKS